MKRERRDRRQWLTGRLRRASREAPRLTRSLRLRAWARGFTARFRPRVRITGVEAVFRRPGAGAVYQCNGVWRIEQRFGPRLQLSILPILRQRVQGAGTARSRVPATVPKLVRQAGRVEMTWVQRRSRPAGRTPNRAVEPTRGLISTALQRVVRVSAVERVFRRLPAPVDTPPAGSTAHFGRTLHRATLHSEEFARRVVRSTRRVEERSFAATESRRLRRSAPRDPVEPSPPPPREVLAATRRPLEASRERARAGAPNLDLEALTDQVMKRVDRRLTVWRERTGRA